MTPTANNLAEARPLDAEKTTPNGASLDHFCEKCGEAYDPKYRRDASKFCGTVCANMAQRKAERRTVTCESCDVQFETKADHGIWPKYCSRLCFTGATDASELKRLTAFIERASDKHIAPRTDQITLADTVYSILQASSYAYLEAPTGSGKSLTMGLIASQLQMDEAIILSHSLDILDQLKRQLALYTERGIIRKISWQFMTWQRFARTHKSQTSTTQKHPLLFVDECHIGGVKHYTGSKISFPLIREHSDRVVWVSATPWQLDETVMGKREGHTAFYSYPDAFDQGLINQADIVRVDCGLQLRLAVQKLEQKTGKPLHKMIEQEFSISGANALETYDQLAEWVKTISDRDLRVSDVKDLARHRYMTMAKIYIKYHRGAKAIFWLPTREAARECSEYLNALAKGDISVAITGETQTKKRRDGMYHAIDRFTSATDSVKVACVVYRLREGFDFDQLTYGFDCAWNPFNYRNAVQKIGRLIRKCDKKPASKYYYAVDVMTVASANNRQFSQRFMSDISELAVLDPEFTAAALADAASYMNHITETKALDPSKASELTYAIGNAKIHSVTYPLFSLSQASGHEIARTLSFDQLFEGRVRTTDIDARLEQIIAAIEAGGPRPTYGSQDYSFMMNYVHPSSRLYRPWARERMERSGAMTTMAERSSRARSRLESLVVQIEKSGTMPTYRSPDGVFLAKYLKKTYTGYRPDLRERLTKCGAFKPITMPTTPIDERVERVMATIEESKTMPSPKSADMQLLRSCIAPSSNNYRKWVHARLQKTGLYTPLAKRTVHVDKRLEALVSAMEAGAPMPTSASKDGRFLRAYITTNPQRTRLAMRKRLIAIGAFKPMVDRRKATDARLKEIIASIENGQPMPAAKTVEGQWLRNHAIVGSEQYRPWVRERLIQCGALTPRTIRSKIVDATLKQLLKRLEIQGPDTPLNSKENSLLIRTMNPSSGSYRDWAAEQLTAIGYLPPEQANKALVKQRLEKLISGIENGMVMPKASTPDGQYLRSYASKASGVYRPEIRARLLKCGAIFDRAEHQASLDEELDKLLREIEAGRPRPPSYSPDARKLRYHADPQRSKSRPWVRQRLLACEPSKNEKHQRSNYENLTRDTCETT